MIRIYAYTPTDTAFRAWRLGVVFVSPRVVHQENWDAEFETENFKLVVAEEEKSIRR